jgi:hypothetical protein
MCNRIFYPPYNRRILKLWRISHSAAGKIKLCRSHSAHFRVFVSHPRWWKFPEYRVTQYNTPKDIAYLTSVARIIQCQEYIKRRSRPNLMCSSLVCLEGLGETTNPLSTACHRADTWPETSQIWSSLFGIRMSENMYREYVPLRARGRWLASLWL